MLLVQELMGAEVPAKGTSERGAGEHTATGTGHEGGTPG